MVDRPTDDDGEPFLHRCPHVEYVGDISIDGYQKRQQYRLCNESLLAHERACPKHRRLVG